MLDHIDQSMIQCKSNLPFMIHYLPLTYPRMQAQIRTHAHTHAGSHKLAHTHTLLQTQKHTPTPMLCFVLAYIYENDLFLFIFSPVILFSAFCFVFRFNHHSCHFLQLYIFYTNTCLKIYIGY